MNITKKQLEKHFKIEDGEVVRISSGVAQTTDPVKFPRELAKVTSTTGMTRRKIKALLLGETLPDNTPKKLADAYKWFKEDQTLRNLWGQVITAKRISLYALSFDILDYDKKTIGRDRLIELIGGPKELSKSEKMKQAHNATSTQISDYYELRLEKVSGVDIHKLIRLSDGKDVTYKQPITLPRAIFEVSGVDASTPGVLIKHLLAGTTFGDPEEISDRIEDHYVYVPLGTRRGKRFFTHCPKTGRNISYDLNYGMKVNSDGYVLLQHRDSKYMMVNSYSPTLPEALWSQAAEIDPKSSEGDLQKRISYPILAYWAFHGELPKRRSTVKICEEGFRVDRAGKSQAFGKRAINNTTDYRGVIEDKRTGRFVASHCRTFIGSYATKEEAYEAYLNERELYYGEFDEHTYITEQHGLVEPRDISHYVVSGGEYKAVGE